MKKTILLTLALASTLAVSAEHYKVIVPVATESEGSEATMVNFDNGDTISVVTVADKAARFEGDIDEAVLARVFVDGARLPVFILEPGTISFDQKEGAFGTMLNDQLRDFERSMNTLQAEFQKAATDAEKEAIYGRYTASLDSAMVANSDNMLGYYFFLNGDVAQLNAPELRELLAKYPDFAKGARVKRYLESAEKREATQPGGKFIDFSVRQPDGTVKSLSDYVGKGKYTLVDFWASWCGPCIRQTRVLKQIQEQYKDDPRLEILGVAVWDKVEDTERAIKQHGLNWDCIVDAQSIPTDLYGITGIPCIILFGPDGTILSRDKQSDELKADVDAALLK